MSVRGATLGANSGDTRASGLQSLPEGAMLTRDEDGGFRDCSGADRVRPGRLEARHEAVGAHREVISASGNLAERTQGEKTSRINDATFLSTRAAARSVIRGRSGGGLAERQNKAIRRNANDISRASLGADAAPEPQPDASARLRFLPVSIVLRPVFSPVSSCSCAGGFSLVRASPCIVIVVKFSPVNRLYFILAACGLQ